MQLEKAGIPTATIVTDEFVTLAKTECCARGMSELPLVEVPHPVGTIPTDALKKVAESAVESIVAGLTRKNGNAEIGTEGGENSHHPEI